MTYTLSGTSYIMQHDEVIPVMRQSQAANAGANWVDGKVVQDPMATTTFEMVGNVQPVPGQDLVTLPEGDRHEDMFYVYTMNNPVEPEVGDILLRQARSYQVVEAEEWGRYTRLRAIYIDSLPSLPDPSDPETPPAGPSRPPLLGF